MSERQARIAELRAFAGLTIKETAETLDVGLTLVKAEWQIARAWLRRELGDPGAGLDPSSDSQAP